jgi:hypothetical protein
MKPNHSPALESLARRFNLSPLEVLEFFNERAAIRQHEGNMPRGSAEEWAVEDCRAYFAMVGSKTAAISPQARFLDATDSYPHPDGRSDSVAKGEP